MFVSNEGDMSQVVERYLWCAKNIQSINEDSLVWRCDQEPGLFMMDGQLVPRPIRDGEVIRHYTFSFVDTDDAVKFHQEWQGDLHDNHPSYVPVDWYPAK